MTHYDREAFDGSSPQRRGGGKELGLAALLSLLLHGGIVTVILWRLPLSQGTLPNAASRGPAYLEAEIVTPIAGESPPASPKEPPEAQEEAETSVEIPERDDLPARSKRVPIIVPEKPNPSEMTLPDPIWRKPVRPKVSPKRKSETRPKADREAIVRKFRIIREIEQTRSGGDSSIPRTMHSESAPPGSAPTDSGKSLDSRLAYYAAKIRNHVRRHWIYPGATVGGRLDAAVVTIRIDPNGKVRSRRLTRSSGDPAFDASVVQAIERADPLPPPPPDLWREIETGISIVFTLKEMQ
ncbi:MAG: TonB family protein [Deltaproteobacteria bacterium]|nr:MAG: TonB family protein [Deltaproteobacteria bacterium]